MLRHPSTPTAEGCPPASLTLTLLAQYRQVHLMDARGGGNLSEAWSAQAVQDPVAVADGIVGCETWWPVERAQVAPVVPLVHPLLAPLMMRQRYVRVLAMPRAGET